MPPEVPELSTGVVLGIGGRWCRIGAPLGTGSFGVVWAAECTGVGEVAIKEIVCQTETELSRASYEAQLLHALTVGGGSVSRVPTYVAAETSQLPTGANRMRLAMSRLPGVPLDRFLHELQPRLRSCAEPSLRSRMVADAFHFAWALVSQLAPTMSFIAASAYHRDVNAHNILIDADADRLEYGLVDFGLAVDASSWMDVSVRNPHGRGEWEFLDVGGDCRYWPASAWLQFEVGCYDLRKASPLCLEYQTHLDFQGLGISALQVLTEMMPDLYGVAQHGGELGVSPGCAETVVRSLSELQAAWAEYWEAATRFWSALLETFRSGGDWNALKNEFVALGVHRIVAGKLQAVKSSMAAVEQACEQAAGVPWAQEACALLSALQVMVSAGEQRSAPASWAEAARSLRSGRPSEPRPRAAKDLGAATPSSQATLPPARVRASEDLSATTSSTRTASARAAVSSDGPSSAHAGSACPPASSGGEGESGLGAPVAIAAAAVAQPPQHAAAAEVESESLAALEADSFLRSLGSLAQRVAELSRDMGRLERADRDMAAAAGARTRALGSRMDSRATLAVAAS